MMPELGRYALEVGLAYGGSLVLLVGLVAMSVLRARQVKRVLDETEARQARG